jgi:hypothetical protein
MWCSNAIVPPRIFIRRSDRLFGPDGRSAYRIFLELVDFLPAVYGLFFVMVTSFGFSRLFPNRPALQKLGLASLLHHTF